MKTDVFPNYGICRISDKESIMALDVEQYENLIGILSFTGKVFDVKVDITSVKHDDDDCNIDVYINHIVRVY